MENIEKDINFLTGILPASYVITKNKREGEDWYGIRCKSKTGFDIDDTEDEEGWEYVYKAMKQHFGDRFMEIDHTTNWAHVDFDVYLRKSNL